MRKLIALALLGAAGPALGAVPLDGTGRISGLAGWRYTPNGYFSGTASDAGYPLSGSSPGGPALTASFGYAATELIELDIELFGSGERLNLSGLGALTSTSYGALAGARLQKVVTPTFWPRGLVPFVGLLTGPVVVDTSGPQIALTEVVANGYAVTAGALINVSDRLAVNIEAKYLFARGIVGSVNSSINGGGVWVGLGLTWLFPKDEKSIGPTDMPSLPNG